MTAYILRRLVHSVFVLAGLTLVVFVVTRTIGDPARLMLPIEATEAQYRGVRAELGLDDPLYVQFGRFAFDLARGDLGLSVWQRVPAAQLVLDRIPATLLLAFSVIAFSLIIAVPMGAISALKPRSALDRFTTTLSIVGVSTPTFWLALMLIILFAVQLGWFKTSGYGGVEYLVLPVLALSVNHIGRIAQVVRSCMLDELSKAYVTTARSKGLLESATVYRHVLRNAAIPVITLVGDEVAGLVNGSVIIEVIFGWPGIGLLAISAIERRDFPLIQADVLIVAALVVAINLVVDLITTAPDPILPNKLIKFKIAPTQWLKNTSEEQMATTAVGTGPYSLIEWQRGGHILLRANANYWGNPKPSIAEVKIIPRKEAGVRASMVQAGEAQLAFSIPPEMAKQVPKAVVEKTTEMVGIRLNTEHPVLKDIRVRQAIAHAIDTNAMMEAFYPGFSTSANGQMVRPASFGSNPNLKPYPVDAAKAKQLVQEAGAVGTPLELVIREANFARITELGEAITSTVSSATGLKVTPRIMEAGQWRETLFAVKPGEKRSDIFMTAASNPTFDSSRVLDAYYGCNGRFSHFCDEAFTQKMTQATSASGPERQKLFQELWQTAYDNYWVLPIFGLDYMHASSAKLVWTPRIDNNWLFGEMQLQD